MNGGGNELLSSPDPELRFCLQNLVWIVLATGGPGKGQSEMTHEPENEEEKLYFFTGSGTGSADHQQVQEVGTCEILEIGQKEPSLERALALSLERALNPAREHPLAQSGQMRMGCLGKDVSP